jgi:hypothetical protein
VLTAQFGNSSITLHQTQNSEGKEEDHYGLRDCDFRSVWKNVLAPIAVARTVTVVENVLVHGLAERLTSLDSSL